jgi:hypothetical protein
MMATPAVQRPGVLNRSAAAGSRRFTKAPQYLTLRKETRMNAEDSPRPYWISEQIDLAALPEPFRIAITEIVNRAYEELVLGAADALERSAATTYVHLLWLELLQQFELGNELESVSRPNLSFGARAEMIMRHLRLVAAKQHTGNFLLRVKAFHEKYAAALNGSTGLPS